MTETQIKWKIVGRGAFNQIAYFIQSTEVRRGYSGQLVFTELTNPDQFAIRFVAGVFATKGKLKKRLRDKAIEEIKKAINEPDFTVNKIMQV